MYEAVLRYEKEELHALANQCFWHVFALKVLNGKRKLL